ncbi:MAG: LysR substrate-binding domain-containing protein [Proteobacteria bacterium]|nr:LysR substrate-binding domain-containing protein [Pseudomonadota bacterium]
MSVRQLNLRDLVYLCAVAEHLNFSRAADACAITQPAMSERIRHVEEALGAVVFERNKRQVLVTHRGQEIVTLARSMLDCADAIEEVVQAHESPLTGTLRLGVIATLGPYLMPHVLRPLRKRYPDLDLHLAEGLTDSLVDALGAGNLDVVLAAQPIDRDDLRSREVFFEPFYLAAPKGHPIVAGGASQRQGLDANDMILLHEGHCLSGQSLDVCPAKRRNGADRLQASGLETLRHMVAAGDRYSLLPALAVGKQPPLKQLIDYSPLDDQRIGRTIAVFWRASYRLTANVDALVETIQDHLPAGIRRID